MTDSKNDDLRRLETLRRNVTLAESKKKVCYEEGEAEKNKNAEYANKLKEEIDRLKSKTLKPSWESDVVLEQPFKSLILQAKCRKEIVAQLDQWTCDVQKQLNVVLHKKKQNDEMIESLKCKKDELLREIPSDPILLNSSSEESKKLQELENDCEKLEMKTVEAELLQKKYHCIKSVLDKDLLKLQKEINHLDEEIAKATNEIPQLESIVESAIDSNQEMDSQLARYDITFRKEKFAWEKSLLAYQKQVEEIEIPDDDDDQEEEELHKLVNSASEIMQQSSMENSSSNGLSKASSPDIKGKSPKGPQFNSKEILDNGQIHKGRNDLKVMKEELEEKLNALAKEKKDLETKINEITFAIETQENEFVCGLQDKVKEKKQKNDDLLTLIEDDRKLIGDLHAALRQLCIKIIQGCKISCSPSLSPSPDDVLDLLMSCIERVEMLVDECRDYDRRSTTKMYEGLKFNENMEEAQSVLKPKKKSQQFEDQFFSALLRSSDDYDSTAAADQEFPTRSMIKRQCKILLDRNAKMHQKGQTQQKQ